MVFPWLANCINNKLWWLQVRKTQDWSYFRAVQRYFLVFAAAIPQQFSHCQTHLSQKVSGFWLVGKMYAKSPRSHYFLHLKPFIETETDIVNVIITCHFFVWSFWKPFSCILKYTKDNIPNLMFFFLTFFYTHCEFVVLSNS